MADRNKSAGSGTNVCLSPNAGVLPISPSKSTRSWLAGARAAATAHKARGPDPAGSWRGNGFSRDREAYDMGSLDKCQVFKACPDEASLFQRWAPLLNNRYLNLDREGSPQYEGARRVGGFLNSEHTPHAFNHLALRRTVTTGHGGRR